MKFLIVDDSEDLREMLVLIITANYNIEITEAFDGQDAINKLNSHGPFDLVISDYNMPNKNGAEFFIELRKHHQSMPFILVSTEVDKFSKLFPGDSNIDTVRKPFEETDLTKKIEKMLAQKNISSQKESYIPVSIDVLETVVYAGVSLFIRLNQNQFIKVLSSSEPFDKSEAKRFRKKELSNLYIELIDIKSFISNYRKNLFSNIEWNSIDTEAALSYLQADWRLVLKSTKSFGWSESVMNLAKENIGKTLLLIKNVPALKKTLARLKISDARSEAATHCYTLAILATAILKELTWDSPSTLQKVTFAALLHDMDLSDTMFDNKLHLIFENKLESEMKQQCNYQIFNHTVKAAEFTSFWTSCPPDVDRLILQHHERFDGKGFPNKLDFLTIFPLAGVMIMAEDIIYQIIINKDTDPIEYLKAHKSYYNQGDFKKIYSATLKVLESYA